MFFSAGTNLISNDVGSVSQIGCPHQVFDVTGIDKSARETVTTVRDGMINFEPFFNDDAGQAHAALSPLPTTDSFYLTGINGQGRAAAALSGKQINYDHNRPADGSITLAVSATGNGLGLEWGRVLSEGVTTSTGAENLASYDGTASTAFGLQAYLAVYAFTGTSCTITIQESSDDGGGDAFAAVTGGAFTAVTGATTERIATATNLTVERYLRLALTGTYSNIQFVVIVNRNTVAPSF
jgi:hypothetical protein